MAVTVTPYNHFTRLIAEGVLDPADSFWVKLYSALTFNPAHTLLSAVDSGGTETTSGTGYTAGGKVIANPSLLTVTTNDAQFDADDVEWAASGGSIAAAYGVVFNNTLAGDPPLFMIDFDGTITALDGADLKIIWDPSGVVLLSVT